jgi:PPOX class probable F420-dependent enzyme
MSITTSSEVDDFLHAPRHAIAATNRRDGPPQLSPVWYLWEDSRFYIGITGDTAKYYNLRRDPRMSLCIDGGREDIRSVTVYGAVELFPKAHPLQVTMRNRLIAHYIPDHDKARRYTESSRDWDTILVVVTPHKIITQHFES